MAGYGCNRFAAAQTRRRAFYHNQWKGFLMLVLARKEGEFVYVGDNIKIVVVKIADGQVKLGFDAPREVPIVRDNAIHTQQK
jgi:carbon storage regulator